MSRFNKNGKHFNVQARTANDAESRINGPSRTRRRSPVIFIKINVGLQTPMIRLI